MCPHDAGRLAGGPAKRLTLLISAHDRIGHSSLSTELMKRARHAHLAGATLFEADQGFGMSGEVHREHMLSDDRPMALVVVDRAHKIEAFLDDVAPLLVGVVATLADVEVLE